MEAIYQLNTCNSFISQLVRNNLPCTKKKKPKCKKNHKYLIIIFPTTPIIPLSHSPNASPVPKK